MFIYPDNLKAKATLRLWQLRDVAIIGVAFLLSVLALAQTGTMLPLVGTVLYAFLAIQVEGSSVLDFLRRAACFLFLQQQYYEWGQKVETLQSKYHSEKGRIKPSPQEAGKCQVIFRL